MGARVGDRADVGVWGGGWGGAGVGVWGWGLGVGFYPTHF